ncbi:C45 family autoproteolytic acyltransferase/hydolase [Litchfieldella xinjiangensis]|uniref:C45 family autoproteolytic acyltransferase/hydolase n=1 Tax=Litchfieldella xinjiangensis TaxID=1166948 RepID=UPI0005BDB392|nr:C45 family peptidase [Halomonas xinjiangensis]
MTVTRLSGSRSAIGRAHGQRHAAQIIDSLEVYARLFRDFAGLDWRQAQHEARRFLPAIERGFPAILDEIEGIAQGAGIAFDDVLALNCRSEISLTRASGGCSAFTLHRQGQQWLAQNWDWRPDQQANVVVLDIEADDKARLASVGEAGMVGKIGLNAHGIGVGLNAIRSQTCGDGLPIHVALRKMLECTDFESARRVAHDDRVASPAHILLASAGGKAVGLEVHPGPPGELTPRRGLVTHTNHLYSEGATETVRDYPKPDSAVRLRRLDALLSEPTEPTPEALFDLLSDHHNTPMSICRHHDAQLPEAERMETLFGVVMNLDRRELHLRLGKPCQNIQALRLSVS